MSFVADVEINGVSLYDGLTYGNFYVSEISGLSPLHPARHTREIMPGALTGVSGRAEIMDKTITIKGTFLAGNPYGNTTLHDGIRTLAALVGWYGDRYREVILRIYHLTAAGAQVAGKEAIYIAVVDDLTVNVQPPISISHAAELSISFLIVGILHPDGIVSRNTSLSGGYTNWAFEDSNCLHGANRILHIIREEAGTNTSDIELYCHAIGSDFVDDHVTGTAVGNIPWRQGAFGTPAAYFDGAGSYYLRYPYIYAIPIAGTFDITVFIRFKRQYTIGDGQWHTLLGDANSAATGFKIMVANGGNSDLIATNGGFTASANGAYVSATEWNTVCARFRSSGSLRYIDIRVDYPGGYQIGSNGSSGGSFPVSGLYLLVGTGPSGTYRANCIIDEVAIWKHAVSDAAWAALYGPTVELPIRQRSEYDLNKRLLFLQDWTRGLNALANRGAMIASSTTLANEELRIDSDRQTMKVLAQSNMALSDAMSTLNTGIFTIVPSFPVIERYNRLTATYTGSSASLSLHSHYMPLERL